MARPADGDDDGEVEREPGLVRPYIITSGRTRPQGTDLHVETVVKRASNPPSFSMGPEHENIMLTSEAPLSVAEIASRTGLPLGVTIVLVSDLVSARQLAASDASHRVDNSFVQRLIEGVRAL